MFFYMDSEGNMKILGLFAILILGMYIGADFTARNMPPELIIKEIVTVAKRKPIQMTVTAYSLREEECNSDLKNTATMVRPVVGLTAAVSRDRLRLLGKKIYVEGYGVREVTDVMNERFKNRIDLLMGTKEAKDFGVRVATVVIIK